MADCEPIMHLIPHGSTGVEVGVARAVSSQRFLEHGCRMFLVDPWAPIPGYEETLGEGNAFEEAMSRLSHFQGWTVLRMTSEQASHGIVFPRGYVDFVFIDGNHKFEYVLQDCCWWWSHLKKGGVLCGHDWNLEAHESGVKRAVSRFASIEKVQIEVHPAVVPGGLDCWSIRKP